MGKICIYAEHGWKQISARNCIRRQQHGLLTSPLKAWSPYGPPGIPCDCILGNKGTLSQRIAVVWRSQLPQLIYKSNELWDILSCHIITILLHRCATRGRSSKTNNLPVELLAGYLRSWTQPWLNFTGYHRWIHGIPSDADVPIWQTIISQVVPEAVWQPAVSSAYFSFF